MTEDEAIQHVSNAINEAAHVFGWPIAERIEVALMQVSKSAPALMTVWAGQYGFDHMSSKAISRIAASLQDQWFAIQLADDEAGQGNEAGE